MDSSLMYLLGITSLSLGLYSGLFVNNSLEKKQLSLISKRGFANADGQVLLNSQFRKGDFGNKKLKAFEQRIISLLLLGRNEPREIRLLFARNEALLKKYTLIFLAWLAASFLFLNRGVAYFVPLSLCLLIFALSVLLRKSLDNFKRSIDSNLVLVADGIAASLSSGLSLVQAFERAGQSNSGPGRLFLEGILAEIALGESADLAFSNQARLFGNKRLVTLASSLRVQYRLGGNIKRLFEEFASQGRREALFYRSLKAQTAQGRLSARLVGVVPLGLVLLMNFFMPGYFNFFFTDSTGQTLLVIAVGLNALGFLLVATLTRVDVS